MTRTSLRHPWAILSMLALVFAIPAAAQESSQPPAAAPSEAAKPQAQTTSAQPADTAPAQPATAAPAARPNAKVLIPSGTHLPLILHNGVSTRSAKPGDPIYLETLFPVMIDGKVVIPAGSYVSGEITESKRPGRVKGRGELLIRLNTLILPNAYQVNLNASPSNAGTGGGETVDSEGKVKGDSSKGSDVGTVITTTAAGAGIGGLATRTPAGAGIGAGIGAAAGLVAVLLTRGPEAELPRGTSLEVVLNRQLELDADKVQFTTPGQASTLAGPPNREPQRTRVSPF
jgi:hypothetical protein